jgi:hypothetical protein
VSGRRFMIRYWSLSMGAAVAMAVVTYLLPVVAVPFAIVYAGGETGRWLIRRDQRRLAP